MPLAIQLLIAFCLLLLAVVAILQAPPIRYLGLIVLAGAVLLAIVALGLP